MPITITNIGTAILHKGSSNFTTKTGLCNFCMEKGRTLYSKLDDTTVQCDLRLLDLQNKLI